LSSSRGKLEVFFCTAPQSEGRSAIAAGMLDWWRSQDVRLRVVTPELAGCELEKFQRWRRIYSDVMAGSDIYILTDDDMQPVTDWRIGVEAMIEHEDFAIISAFPANCTINRWTPEDYDTYEDLDVMEHHSVGGLRVMRRGSMVKGWPKQDGIGYDGIHCESLRESGFRVGYAQHFRAIHLGEGCSDIWLKNSLENA
jgi:hypothetical protein